MKSKLYWIVFIVALILNSIVSIIIYDYFFSTRVAYVKSGVLLSEYSGLSALNQQFQSELKVVQSNYDTLQRRAEYIASRKGIMNPKEWNFQMNVAQSDLKKYQETALPEMESRKKELTQKVLAEINKHIQQYGEEHNISFILGTTDDGSILYGSDKWDITDKLLEELNGSSGKSTEESNN